MGLALPTVQAFLQLWKDGHLSGKNSIVELGSQELHLPFDDFEEAVCGFGVPTFEPEDFMPWEWENRGKCCYADKFYSLFGLNEYKCFDMNGENSAIVHDLNEPFEQNEYFERFDVVTDFGCAEHVFNVSEVFRTMHKVCKPNGLFVHCQQMYNTNGYYLFDPAYYEDLAAANGYEILFSSFILDAPSSMKDSGNHSWHVPLSTELLDTIDLSKLTTVSVFYVMKKINDAAFKTPYQGQYMSDVYKNHGYEVAAMSNYRAPSRKYVPVIDRYNVSSRVFKKTCKAYFKKKFGLK